MAISQTLAQAILATGQTPDILGRFEQGQQFQREGEARIAAAKSKELQGQLFAQQFSPDSQMARLAGHDPEAAMKLADAVGIPRNKMERLTMYGQELDSIMRTSGGDPQKAMRGMLKFTMKLDMMGVPHPQINQHLADFQRAPVQGMKDMATLRDAFMDGGVIPESPERKRAQARELATFKTDEQIRLEEAKAGITKTAAERKASAQAAIDEAKAKGEGKKARALVTKELRATRRDLTKAFRVTEDAFRKIQTVGPQATAASDLALIFNYMKVLDPGSVVRESEFANAQNAGGVDDRTRALWNSLLEGTRLSADQRTDFIGRSSDLFDSAQLSIDEQIDRDIVQVAGAEGVDLSKVLGETEREALRERQEHRAFIASTQTGAATDAPTPTGRTATNPTTGEKLQEMANGSWIPVQ